MFYGKRVISLITFTLLLSGCSSGVSSNSQESFISGNGAVTFIKASARDLAPAFSGMTLTGENYSFAIGQVTVVNVWASWCSPCRAEAPTLVELARKYSDVPFIGILTRDNPAAARAFVRRFGLLYPTLIDDYILLGFRSSLPANAIPVTVVIDKLGRVAGRISGEVTVATLSQLIEKVTAE